MIYKIISGTNKSELEREIEKARGEYVPCGTVINHIHPFVWSLPIVKKAFLEESNRDNKRFSMEECEKKWIGITDHMV